MKIDVKRPLFALMLIGQLYRFVGSKALSNFIASCLKQMKEKYKQKYILKYTHSLIDHFYQSIHFYITFDIEYIIRNFKEGAILSTNGKKKVYYVV